MALIINPWFGISFVLTILGSFLSLLQWGKRRYAPHPEVVRKLLHIGMGLTTLTFPWLFEANWPVLLLAAITVPGLILLRRSTGLRKRLGGVINGVNRAKSLGEIYFPLGVAGLFILSGGDPLRYTIPILLLTLADAVAALIGVRYGRTRFTTAEGYKSAEGSLAFFAVAFGSVYLPLSIFGDRAPFAALLTALIMALLMVLVEAVAWKGLDNLLIPIVGFLLLEAFLAMPASTLVGRLVLTTALVIFVLLWRKRANLHDSALLGAALIGYLSWVLADWRWLVGPLLIFGSHIGLSSGYDWQQLFGLRTRSSAVSQQASPSSVTNQQPYNIHAVISVASAGLFWLFLFRALRWPELYYLFTLSFAAQLTFMLIVTHKHKERSSSIFSIAVHAVSAWIVLFLPFVLVGGLVDVTLKQILFAVPAVALAALLFYTSQPVLNTYPTGGARWVRQGVCAWLASAVGMVGLYLL